MVSAMTSMPCARIARAFVVMATVAATGARPSRCANSGMGQRSPSQKCWMRPQALARLSVSVA